MVALPPANATGKATGPLVRLEKTRSQYQCRTGQAGPGQNRSFKFGPGKFCKYATKQEAFAAANKWLSDYIASQQD